MTFGDAAEFAIDAFHEPSAAKWAGFGRMALTIQGVRLGELRENHCSLFHAVDRFRDLRRSVQSLWDDVFNPLSDEEIFSFLDEVLYHREISQWDRFGRFDFRTNTGEQFDGWKSFIVCRPPGDVHVLMGAGTDSARSAVCSASTFSGVADAFVRWFDEQVGTAAPPYFPVDPLSFDRKVQGV